LVPMLDAELSVLPTSKIDNNAVIVLRSCSILVLP